MAARHERIVLRAGNGRTECLIGAGISQRLPDSIAGREAFLVVDALAARRHPGALAKVIESSGSGGAPLALRGGEAVKTHAGLERIHRGLLRRALPRDGVLAAIGGGTILDVAGFAAATWSRGIALISVPTTLLAMTDAALGGKTGINVDGVKNQVGSFHAAETVLIDPDFLATLPRREWRRGLAEMVKTAVIGAPALFRSLEDARPGLSAAFAAGRAADTVPEASSLPWTGWIAAAAGVKARIVGRDFRETGARKALNLGHTLGHALESKLGIGHGEAVALGMAAVARHAARTGSCPAELPRRLESVLTACGLPVRTDPPAAAAIAPLVGRDKKRGGGGGIWVLPRRLGSVAIDRNAELGDILAALAG